VGVSVPQGIIGATEAARDAAYDRLARAVLDRLRPPNPIRAALILADTGLADGTPTVALRVDGVRRQALYPLPSAIRVGRLVFYQAVAPGVARLVVVASNYQVEPYNVPPRQSGSGLGYPAQASGGALVSGGMPGVGAGAGAGVPAGTGGPGGGGTTTDGTTGLPTMTDWTIADGSALPLALGEVGH